MQNRNRRREYLEKKIVSEIMTVLLLIGILPIAFVHLVRSADIIHDVDI